MFHGFFFTKDLAIVSSLSLLLRGEKGLPQMGYKGRDTKESVKRGGMRKGGIIKRGSRNFLKRKNLQKVEFIEKYNNIFRINS